jgi:hypothetical protein
MLEPGASIGRLRSPRLAVVYVHKGGWYAGSVHDSPTTIASIILSPGSGAALCIHAQQAGQVAAED